MRYIKSYNEYFIGSLFKGLKNKLSLKYSKMFGKVAEADKLMEEYKVEIQNAQRQKIMALRALGEYFNKEKSGVEVYEEDLKKIKSDIEITTKNFNEQVKIIKQKFDIRFEEVIKDEKNPKIKNYIVLKKLEMQQELLSQELNTLLTESGLKEEDITDPDFKKIIDTIKNKSSQSDKKVEEQNKLLSQRESEEGAFDLQKAMEQADKVKNGEVPYLWEDSPFLEYTFKQGDKITFFSNSNKEETQAEVIEDLTNRVKVKTANSDGITISKGSIMTSERYNEENKKEEEETEETTL